MKDLSPSQQDTLKTLQIIASVLIAALVLSMITSVLRFPFFKGEVPDGASVLISYWALALSLLAALVIRPLFLASIRRPRNSEGKNDEPSSQKDPALRFMRYTLVEQALFEGMGQCNLAAYVSERQIWSLLVTTAIILWMVFRFPKRARAARWIEDQRVAENRF